MDLLTLAGLVGGLPGYRAVVRAIEAGGEPATASLIDAAKPLLLAALWRERGRPVLVVTARPETARHLHEQIGAYAGDDPGLLHLPEPDALPFERLVSDPATVRQRLMVLARLAGVEYPSGRPGPDVSGCGPAPLVLASAYAVAVKTLAPDRLRAATLRLQRGGRADLLELLRRLAALGYRPETAVQTPGTVSRRGGIVDVYPPASAGPVRIELFGDVVESIRSFDPATQRSGDLLSSVLITPADEALPPERGEGLPTFDTGPLSPEAQARFTRDMDRLRAGQWFEEMELYRGILSGSTALDYLPPDGLLVWDQPADIAQALDEIAAQAEEVRAGLVRDGALPAEMPAPSISWRELEERGRAAPRRLVLNAFGGAEATLPFAAAPGYAGRTRLLLNGVAQWRAEGRRIVLVSQQAPRLAELLQDAGIPASPAPRLASLPPPGSVALVHGSLSAGWALEPEAIVLLSDAELFGITKKYRVARRRPVQRQSFLAELSAGDYVVHIDHGIARFAGTLVRRSGDREREYLVLEYAAGDRLLVPTEQIDRVGPYVGASERPPSLTRLATQEWSRIKERVKASTAQVARGLLALYAAREVVVGHACGPDTPWQGELEASFPYVETPDQLRAIGEVKADMERPKPMDRLITGDVGYGKTEVAVRAAFKAVTDGRQVAILVPTTVLAQQHFTTFSERMAPFPVRVEMLSRFRSPREQDAVVAGLESGAVDICIGTHRLLQKDVRFKDLGLVVIDEEQRFGVVHKERLKELRREVDVLSMSATPIPRTLYMALAGVRDMSIMETPPEERLPIKTYVSVFNEAMAREAMLRELERGGQGFFVHNRVHSIAVIADRIARLVPEAKVVIAHGQMPEDRLEAVMLEFAQGKADILVSTTIIESGLDMPNVNTLIVSDSDRMGLSQLYQLRGRVGRGATRAYAYFFYHPERRLTEAAEKRLKTILSATELGAGFQIAMKDLEIRGAGNLLGVEQHGQIAAVGFDLYVRLLADAVAELNENGLVGAGGLKAGLEGAPRPPLSGYPGHPPQPAIDLPLPAHVPEPYVPDLATRLGLYQKMAALQEPTDVDALAEELKDRFGPWPEPVENLLFMLKVKLLAARAGVLSVSHETGEIVLAGDEKTWTALLGVQRPYGDGVRIGHTRVRLDIKRLGGRWRTVLERVLTQVGEQGREPARVVR